MCPPRMRAPDLLDRMPPHHSVGVRRRDEAGKPRHALPGAPSADPLHGVGRAGTERAAGVHPSEMDASSNSGRAEERFLTSPQRARDPSSCARSAAASAAGTDILLAAFGPAPLSRLSRRRLRHTAATAEASSPPDGWPICHGLQPGSGPPTRRLASLGARDPDTGGRPYRRDGSPRISWSTSYRPVPRRCSSGSAAWIRATSDSTTSSRPPSHERACAPSSSQAGRTRTRR